MSEPTIFPSQQLFDWYDRHGRDLPWRRRWPELAQPYHVWLSEIMLQQTVVAAVIPYFLEFTRRWPDVHALAAAPLNEVLSAWAGLGYYARARNLHKAAIAISSEHGGSFPAVPDQLRSLPGIGPYTAGAIAAMANGHQVVVVDGNIERLFCRFFAIETPLPAAKAKIQAYYESALPVVRPSDFPQAMMDFANAVCTSKQPGCDICPLAGSCAGFAKGLVATLPVKPLKTPKTLRSAVVFVSINPLGEVFLERRPPKGLLGGMLGFPEAGLSNKNGAGEPLVATPPFNADWVVLDEKVRHIFTHFIAEIEVRIALVDEQSPCSAGIIGGWFPPRPADLPSLMRKVWYKAKPATKDDVTRANTSG